MHPWIRVNGSLNRRVLDKWLGLVLLFCVSHIGCTIHRVATRFNLMQPLQIRLLLEYLEDIDCVKLVTVSQQKKITLCSTYETQVIGKKKQTHQLINCLIHFFLIVIFRNGNRFRFFGTGICSSATGRIDENVTFHWRQKVHG